MWPWEERHEKSGCILLSMPGETDSIVQEDSGGLAETHASGNREYTRKVVQNIKDQLGYDESISEISINSGKMHISIWTKFMASSMQDPSYEQNLEFFKNSEFENIKSLFGNTRMMIEGNSEIKNDFPADVASSLWEKHVLLQRASNKVDESKSVRQLGLRVTLWKTTRSRRCNKKVE